MLSMLDLLLASAHHLLVFAVAALIGVELVLLRSGLSAETLVRLGRIDRAYGGLAGAVILVGIARVLFGLKGWEFYVYNAMFWAKMAAFVVVGLLSIEPTRRILAWNRALRQEGRTSVPDAEVASLRRYVLAQAGVFALIPVLAAALARGIGY